MSLYTSYDPDYSNGRTSIVNAGKAEATGRAQTDYPHAVYRDSQGAMQNAEQAFTAFLTSKSDQSERNGDWYKNHVGEIKRLFTSTFVGTYLEKVAEQDKKEGRSSAVPTASLGTLQGATVRLTRVDRKANEHVYSLELTDPENFEGVEKTEWVVYFEGASVPSTAAASATAAYGMASSASAAYAYGASTPQKSVRKPKGSYLRSP